MHPSPTTVSVIRWLANVAPALLPVALAYLEVHRDEQRGDDAAGQQLEHHVRDGVGEVVRRGKPVAPMAKAIAHIRTNPVIRDTSVAVDMVAVERAMDGREMAASEVVAGETRSAGEHIVANRGCPAAFAILGSGTPPRAELALSPAILARSTRIASGRRPGRRSCP